MTREAELKQIIALHKKYIRGIIHKTITVNDPQVAIARSIRVIRECWGEYKKLKEELCH